MGALHGLGVGPPPTGVAPNTGCVGKADVGRGSGVKVGKGVGLGVSVGGTGVAVGMADCVIATTVHAAETAVP